LISGGKISDTTFTDTGINTMDKIFNYKIVVYDNSGVAFDTTLSASTVRLDPIPVSSAIELHWKAVVPWSNVASGHPMHLIYRDQVDTNDPGKFVLIDSTNVLLDGMIYLDDGSATGDGSLIDTQEYCYYVVTRGAYGNSKVKEPLVNKSQIVCAQPNDTVPPCTPINHSIINENIFPDCQEALANIPCDSHDFSNELSWEVMTEGDCQNDVRSFNIYFSETGEEGTFNLIDNTTSTSFIHENLSSFKGCYRITAVDRSGNESSPTETLCNDNCPSYRLPNVFTPNADGFNDTFMAYNISVPNESGGNDFICARFVKSVEFRVYNRYGKEVFNNIGEPENSILINWDGKTNDGKLLPTGVYFYHALVKFDVLESSLREKEFKGWVKLQY
jgi:gliding motility-associated-like protein